MEEAVASFWVNLIDTFSSVQARCVYNIYSSLDPDSAAISAAAFMGHDQALPARIKEGFIQSGTIHIIALSGYNISLIVGALTWLCGFYMGKFSRLSLILAAMAGFILVTGASASLVRAGLMTFIGTISHYLGRLCDIRWALIITCITMISFQPNIIFDLGFLLSVSSLAGIMAFQERLTAYLPSSLANHFSWKEIVSTTLAAQLGVLPILLLIFQSFPSLFLIANLLIIPTLPILMAGSFIVILTGFVSIPLSTILALPIVLVCRWINFVTSSTSVGSVVLPAGHYAHLLALLLAIITIKYCFDRRHTLATSVV